MSSLQDVVNAGEGEQDAVALGDGIVMSQGVANLYRILTDDGDVQINTGMASHAAEHARRFAAAGCGPLRTIILTQGHPDHMGGWSHFDGPGVETIAHAQHADVREYWRSLRPFYSARIERLWGRFRPSSEENRFPAEAVVTTTFHDRHAFALGGRQFELYATPGGETLDSLVVWLPDERTVFIGNLIGPMFGHVPNLYTIRGDKIRSAMAFLRSIERVRDLEPEVLLNGHHRFEGAASIRETFDRVHAAMTHLRDRTIEGMNAGRTLWQLMDEIGLPDELQLPQLHGKVAWIVRAIFEEHVGWFRYESTTELYEVPFSAVWSDLVELAGAGPLAERALAHAEAGRPLPALHLAEVVLAQQPDESTAAAAKRSALEQLLERSGGENFSEVTWLETELAAPDGDR